MKQYYRLICPLCGKSSYEKNFSRINVFKLMIQTFGGRGKIHYNQVLDLGVLNQFHAFIIQRIEDLYLRLTGVDIQKLKRQQGGDNECLKPSYVLEPNVRKSSSLRTVRQSINLENRVSPTINQAKLFSRIT